MSTTRTRDDATSVPMIRAREEERTFDREKVLGRDTASVFPSTTGGETSESARAAVQRKFITESELMTMRESERGGGDGGRETGKPLYQILAEREEHKEQEFQEKWASMKVGKNRPLDADEAEFLDEVENERRAAELKRKREENDELEKFKSLQRGTSATVREVENAPPAQETPKPVVAVVKKKPTRVKARIKEPIEKKPSEVEKSSNENGLAGLLGDYTDSDGE